jgi:Lon protease-like protein
MSEDGPPPAIADLPRTLAIFPLAGVVLLPGGRLPLNIFEPRYLEMVRDSLTAARIIGMVQPTEPHERNQAPAVYGIGCAGRMTAFRETDDGRYLIALKGVCRFAIVEELSATTMYRQVIASYDSFGHDLEPASEDEGDVDRGRLLQALRPFLDVHKIRADWETLEKVGSSTLVTSLAMMCPFEPREKQALLEAPTLAVRSELVTNLIEMAVLESGTNDSPLH